MARLSPQDIHPLLSFRFKVIFSILDNVQFYGKAITLPAAENNPLTIDYGNTYIKVKGKTRWNDVTMTCYAFEDMTHNELFDWLNGLHQKIDEGKDWYGDDYKKDITIQLLSPGADRVVGTWKLIGAFINTVNFGNMDFSSEEIIQPEVTISYDYAMYEPGTPRQQAQQPGA